jgi:hypothetical protein
MGNLFSTPLVNAITSATVNSNINRMFLPPAIEVLHHRKSLCHIAHNRKGKRIWKCSPSRKSYGHVGLMLSPAFQCVVRPGMWHARIIVVGAFPRAANIGIAVRGSPFQCRLWIDGNFNRSKRNRKTTAISIRITRAHRSLHWGGSDSVYSFFEVSGFKPSFGRK